MSREEETDDAEARRLEGLDLLGRSTEGMDGEEDGEAAASKQIGTRGNAMPWCRRV